ETRPRAERIGAAERVMELLFEAGTEAIIEKLFAIDRVRQGLAKEVIVKLRPAVVDSQEIDTPVRQIVENDHVASTALQRFDESGREVEEQVQLPTGEICAGIPGVEEANLANARQADLSGPAAVVRVGDEDGVLAAADGFSTVVLVGAAADWIGRESRVVRPA